MHISPNDHRRYHYIRLDNALPVLLISDPKATRSAAALSVKVGHFSDPPEREGLAHFLEHMLFLGTEKYPKVGEFQEFINQHGGTNNAWTGTENTTYFFDVHPNYFSEALDRFGQFFTSPLFNAEAVDKERNAIESEYRLKIQDDVRRIYQVKKEIVNPEHPFAKFSVGNSDTLADRAGRAVRDDLLSFYQNHYSANLMTLVLLAPCSLEELNASATHTFSCITNADLVPDEPKVPLIGSAQVMQFVEIEPIKDLRKLSLTFPLVHDKNDYKNKSLSYVAHLLGDESGGSLMSLLKSKNWINQLSAGGGLAGSNFREFVVSIDLTELGLNYVDDIVCYIFQSIALIREQGISQWRYDEMKMVRETAYHFKESSRPLDTVSHLVMNMQHYEQNDVLYGDFMMQRFDKVEITGILAQLRPENMNITLIAKGGKYNKRASWYSTPYDTKPFTKNQLDKWLIKQISSKLILPKPNPFISSEIAPLSLEQPNVKKPTQLENEEGFCLWHLQESEFHIPKGVIYISIDSPHTVSTVSNIVKTHLCVEMLLDAINEIAYPAEIAGLNYNIYNHQGGVTLKLSGFTQKLPLLLELIIDKFLHRDFDANRFENSKTQLLRGWKNALKEKPIARLYNSFLGLVQSNNPPYEALIEAIKPIVIDELPEFVLHILSCIYIEVFFYGNWDKNQSINIGKQIQKALYVENQCYQASERPMWMLDGLQSVYYEKNCESEDSAVVVYYQSLGKQCQDIALYSFTHHLMAAVFFNELRTKRQLGYMVGVTYRMLNNQPGLLFYVQSPLAGPSKLLEAIDDFLNAFFLVLLELNETQWHASKQGIIAKLKEPDANLRARSQRLWQSIASQDYDFNRKEMIVDAISNMSRDQMIRFAVEKLKPRRANRLVLHSCSLAHLAQKITQQGSTII